jgi:hypothetical protein
MISLQATRKRSSGGFSADGGNIHWGKEGCNRFMTRREENFGVSEAQNGAGAFRLAGVSKRRI